MKTNELTGAALDWAVCVADYGYGADYKTLRFSTNWAHGGPLIEREKISGISYYPDINCFTQEVLPNWRAQMGAHTGYGPTPLIAAMRCYVSSKLGNIVEIPEELL